MNVRPRSNMSSLRYKTAPNCSLSGPLCHSGAGRTSGAAGPVRSYNPVFTYPCQTGCPPFPHLPRPLEFCLHPNRISGVRRQPLLKAPEVLLDNLQDHGPAGPGAAPQCPSPDRLSARRFPQTRPGPDASRPPPGHPTQQRGILDSSLRPHSLKPHSRTPHSPAPWPGPASPARFPATAYGSSARRCHRQRAPQTPHR